MPSPFNRFRPYDSARPKPPRPEPMPERSARAVRTLARLSACLGALAVGAVVFAIAVSTSSQARLSVYDGDVRPVCVANEAVPAGTTLESDMLRVEDIPAAYVSEGALSSPEEAAGCVAVSPIPANGQVASTSVAAAGNASSLANALEPGFQAISVAVDAESGLAGLIRPGDHVDVLAEGRLAVANATVLALDSSLGEAQEEYATVTIQVSSEDALAIQAQQELAPVRFVMRAAADVLAERADGAAEAPAEDAAEQGGPKEGGDWR